MSRIAVQVNGKTLFAIEARENEDVRARVLALPEFQWVKVLKSVLVPNVLLNVLTPEGGIENVKQAMVSLYGTKQHDEERKNYY